MSRRRLQGVDNRTADQTHNVTIKRHCTLPNIGHPFMSDRPFEEQLGDERSLGQAAIHEGLAERQV